MEGVGRSSLLHGVDFKTLLISHFPSERVDVERVSIAMWEIYVFISDLGLMDLPLEVGRRCVYLVYEPPSMSKLDRFLIILNWEEIFLQFNCQIASRIFLNFNGIKRTV